MGAAVPAAPVAAAGFGAVAAAFFAGAADFAGVDGVWASAIAGRRVSKKRI